VQDDGGAVGRRAAEGPVQARTGPTDVAQGQASAAAVQQGFRVVGPDGEGAVEVVDGRAETAEQVPDQPGVVARFGVVRVQARGPAEVGSAPATSPACKRAMPRQLHSLAADTAGNSRAAPGRKSMVSCRAFMG
jgi:hypothetical protein